MTLKVIHRLQTFSNAIRRTFVQHFTRFQLTVSFLYNFTPHKISSELLRVQNSNFVHGLVTKSTNLQLTNVRYWAWSGPCDTFSLPYNRRQQVAHCTQNDQKYVTNSKANCVTSVVMVTSTSSFKRRLSKFIINDGSGHFFH